MAKTIKTNKDKDLKISESKTKSKDNDKGSRSKIIKHEGTSLQRKVIIISSNDKDLSNDEEIILIGYISFSDTDDDNDLESDNENDTSSVKEPETASTS
ncbi:hypothetical protein Tco_1122869 [Tanacetum coccineum]|uniref:Uncharacterized protein n=1 Tax=Tanacetum coccineum TaxID=301880 RepID=A0ABQ5J214_9ASTR